MLKLKKLQILGFKSFCDRTELKFPGDGVAAIIGPNGCGKSNISDAIAWVLGEQSAKTLRGARMEDVIFAGTRDRKPTGMAEVSLTLVDPDVYDGDTSGDTEIEIRDEMPADDDWDEAQLRESAAKETDEYQEEVQPHQSADGLRRTADGAVAETNDQADSAVDREPSTVDPAAASNEPRATSDDDDISREPSTVEAAQTQHPAVVLKIRRRKFKQNFTAGEIVVTRRLFRSGDSEYLLNGKLCRLRDIQDIFMGTGLGPESYAIIEQGRIGQILSSKPTDRRAIIEEAAGITKFKTRKRLAEARLEEAKVNLNRVNDIFEEVTRQMNSLKRQAAKAERYGRLRDEMREKLRLVLASKLAQLRHEREEIEAELARLSEDLRLRGEFVQSLETENSEATQRGYAVDTEAKENRERLSANHLASDRASARQKNNEERCRELVARIDSAGAELEQTSQQLATLESERQGNRAALESAQAEVSAAQQEAAAREQDAVAAAGALAEGESEQEQRRRQVLLAVAESAAVHNHIARAQEHIAGLDRELRRLNAELAAAQQQVEVFGGQRGQIAFEFETASQKVGALVAQIDGTRSTLAQKRQEEIESKKRLDTLRAEYATALGRRSSLVAVIAEHGYSTESVKRLFQSGALHSGFAPAGVLADFLEVDDRYEHVVEDFLRDELNYIVVKSWDAADEGLRMLRTDVDGRATFLVHPSDAQARFSFTVDEAAHSAPRREHAITPLKNCIRVLDGFGKSLEVVLPKLRDGYIVPDPVAARDLALENPDAFFLSESGECFHNVTVTGGKQRSEGPLSLKRELRDVLRQLSEIENALREEEGRSALLSKEISELNSLLDRLEGERREADKAALTSGHNLKQLESEMARVRGRLETYERELRQVSADRAASEARVAEKQNELAACEQRKAELERASEAAQESLAVLRQARDAAVQAASEVKARVAALEERSRAAAQAMTRLNAQIDEMNRRLQSLDAQRDAAIAEKAQREAENLQIAEQLVSLVAEREQAQARADELQRLSEEIRQRLAQVEDELKAARAELDGVRDRRGEVAATSARLASDEQHLRDTAVTELGVAADDLLADETLVRVEGDQLTAEESAYREMRAKLEAMGPVNMMALEEYKEAAQRHEFLDAQRKDLLDAIDNTQKTIKEIEVTCAEKFRDAFTHINENFQATFKKLFGGGQGFMRLTDEENTAESGIDVVASPPGKKLQNVLLLSGGEKALTALALLVGIFQYAPSPFCILDEVDAPLDEANVGRFTELVREMSVQTQFVLITHSKKTMSIAPVMYGVTMQEPGVSKLVSVRFGDPAQAATA